MRMLILRIISNFNHFPEIHISIPLICNIQPDQIILLKYIR